METSEVKKLITDNLNQTKMMQIATISDGKPWICNVWFVTDDDLNIYWLSSTKVRHSQAISIDPNVAIAFYKFQQPSDPSVAGVQMEGTAEILTDQEDIEKAIQLYSERIFGLDMIKQFMSSPYEPRRFYRAKASRFIVLDTAFSQEDPYHEYKPEIKG